MRALPRRGWASTGISGRDSCSPTMAGIACPDAVRQGAGVVDHESAGMGSNASAMDDVSRRPKWAMRKLPGACTSPDRRALLAERGATGREFRGRDAGVDQHAAAQRPAATDGQGGISASP